LKGTTAEGQEYRAFRYVSWTNGSQNKKGVKYLYIDIDFLSFITELIGTVAFAVSGAMLAIDRELDFFGVLFLGAITAIGGGIIRDLLLGRIPPHAFLNYVYLLVSVVSAFLVFVFSYFQMRRGGQRYFISDSLLNIFDAAGLGIFSVIGVQNTISAGFGDNAFFCIFLGMTTGVGGGMLRDILSKTTPAVLRKHIYAVASLLGALCYYYFRYLSEAGSILLSVILVIVLRVLASHYCWTLPRIPIQGRN
jgi:uncharacterized membrane protein YeiH